MGTRHHGNIWWCHGKVSEKVFMIYGWECYQWETRTEETLTYFSCPHSVEPCVLAPDRNTASGQLPNAAYPHSGILRTTHVAWLSAIVLYNFNFAICVPREFYQSCSLHKVEIKNFWQPLASPRTCCPWATTISNITPTLLRLWQATHHRLHVSIWINTCCGGTNCLFWAKRSHCA